MADRPAKSRTKSERISFIFKILAAFWQFILNNFTIPPILFELELQLFEKSCIKKHLNVRILGL